MVEEITFGNKTMDYITSQNPGGILTPPKLLFKATMNFEFILTDAVTGKVKSVSRYNNITTNPYLYVLARIAAGDTTYTGAVNYVAIGTSLVAPLNTDTQLGTEIARVAFSARSFTLNQAFFTFFFNSATGNGSLTEVGMFSDATATTNSGQMVDHASINVIKTSSDNLTVNGTLNFTA